MAERMQTRMPRRTPEIRAATAALAPMKVAVPPLDLRAIRVARRTRRAASAGSVIMAATTLESARALQQPLDPLRIVQRGQRLRAKALRRIIRHRAETATRGRDSRASAPGGRPLDTEIPATMGGRTRERRRA